MGGRSQLGEFAHLILAAALRLDRPYGASLVREIEDRTGRQVQAGSLYITLDRLEQRGLVRLSTGQPEPGRGGRPKRYVEVTEEGIQAVADHRQALLRIWSGLEARLEADG
ncbi:MAG: PadR family transcriptional regulator [Gemmatimonadota bacterium]|nr:PadR family transcriptional regulator [Gemmatimonadota bacterium]